MKLPIYLIVFLLAVSLALAVTPSITTNGDAFSGNEQVIITVNGCVSPSILKIFNPSDTLVDIKSGSGNMVVKYNTQSDSSDGKYKIRISCTNGEYSKFFCVDANNCLAAAASSAGTTTTTSTSSGSSPGGYACKSDWSCSAWSVCGTNLKQTRTCIDKNKCVSSKTETKDCVSCEESWVCSLWSECYNNMNERACYDEYKCGTTFKKPQLKKSCQEFLASGLPPQRISTQLPPPIYYQQPASEKQSSLEKFWKAYGLYALAGILGLILFIVILVLLIKLLKPRRKAFNLDELVQWAKKERGMGTSMEDIKDILEEHTGWKENEINIVMRELEKDRFYAKMKSGLKKSPQTSVKK